MARELNLELETIFTGYVDEEEMADMYNLCDLYVMPNREVTQSTDSIEGFGIVFLEASSCGKPVIAGKSGGTSEAVLDGVTGFLIDPDDEEALANKIVQILRNPSMRKEIGEKGRAWVINKFSWEKSASQVMPFV
jgi:phosphatidylinositol alpha-1,6-mannosyltransferase